MIMASLHLILAHWFLNNLLKLIPWSIAALFEISRKEKKNELLGHLIVCMHVEAA